MRIRRIDARRAYMSHICPMQDHFSSNNNNNNVFVILYYSHGKYYSPTIEYELTPCVATQTQAALTAVVDSLVV